MCFARLVAILVIFIAPSAASAWNSRGHMMVTAVAWEQLEEPDPKTGRRTTQAQPKLRGLDQGSSESRPGQDGVHEGFYLAGLSTRHCRETRTRRRCSFGLST
jgi:hypothetical protein